MVTEDGGNVRIGQAAATVTMTDSRSLLSPELMQAIIAEVLLELRSREQGERSLRRDTRIGGCGCDGAEEGA